jgi:hypothetical protein
MSLILIPREDRREEQGKRMKGEAWGVKGKGQELKGKG